MAFQAWPASPVGVQPDSGMGCDIGGLPRQYVCPEFIVLSLWFGFITKYRTSAIVQH
ncbi:hypothetical protein DSO57_1006411 [Entomophthora muscae]|uniref:Uncharacterized protein n=1 Tax=Entomophthora muscae TaxID=34485 RepID=A0ACC2UHA6_9FUNG|nr:hypothetical protein DSO57_1006411 [Entomophthora muscae]